MESDAQNTLPKELTVAFTGGRDNNNAYVTEWISALKELERQGVNVYVNVGDADGVDARVRSESLLISKRITFYADWDKYGKAAGPIRNGHMLENADLLIAFEGGKGTANCIYQAQRLGIPVLYGKQKTRIIRKAPKGLKVFDD